MCLVRTNIHCGPKYATKDIICYKVLCKNDRHEYFSPFRHFIYKLNKCVSSNFSFMLSSIRIQSPQIEYNFSKIFKNFNCVTEGLHSFKYLSDAIGFKDCFIKGGIVMECTIPKGSWYYDGTNCELVSDNIIINREIVI